MNIYKIYLRALSIFCVLHIWTFSAQAQNTQYTFFGEGDKNTVKLFWMPTKWEKGLTEFDIKRRAINNGKTGNWSILNQKPIFPEINPDKDLSNIEPSEAERQRLRSKLQARIAEGKSKAIPQADYLEKLKSDTNALRALLLPFSLDYDFALVNGFGLIDRNIAPATEYEYGLFPRINNTTANTPAATWKWKFNTKANVQTDVKLSFKPSAMKNMMQLYGVVNMDKFKANKLNGFNIYRKASTESAYMQLNKNGLIFPDKNGDLNFFDEAFSANTLYAYAIEPVSFFGTKGTRTEITYDPAKQPKDITPPVLRNVASPVSTKSIALDWDFAKTDETEITGFQVERMNDNAKGYEKTGNLINSSSRNYTDTKNLINKTYYRYRLLVQTNSGQTIYSNELLLYYQTETPPPAPKNLTGKWLKEDGKYFIQLKWDKRASSDTSTKSYRLYTSFPPDTALFWEGNIAPIKENNYKYEIIYAKASKYRFAVSAINADKDESPLSNKIEVLAPTAMLPNTKIWPFTVAENMVTLNWKYDEIADLKGFVIYQDGKIIANTGKEARNWKSATLEPGKTYTFELQSVTTTGVESKRSIPVSVSIAKTKP